VVFAYVQDKLVQKNVSMVVLEIFLALLAVKQAKTIQKYHFGGIFFRENSRNDIT
jgi:hypothetical protein